MADSFPKGEHAVKLTGEEWFALLAALAGRSFSSRGLAVLDSAKVKIATQVGEASKACHRTDAKDKIDVLKTVSL